MYNIDSFCDSVDKNQVPVLCMLSENSGNKNNFRLDFIAPAGYDFPQ